jgi:ERCC4-type nuclease
MLLFIYTPFRSVPFRSFDMLIKIDCREKDLLHLMRPVAGGAAVSPATNPTTVVAAAAAAAPEPDHYLMDLGDGMTIKVPLPKKTPASCKDKSLAATATTTTTTTIHEIKSERLPLGDIIIHDPTEGRDIVLFERKSLNDLAASIQDGRYKEQSFRLTQTTDFHNHNIIYIIEGDIARYNAKHSRISKSALQSAMVSLLYYKGFSVIRTMNVGETAEFILHFADKVMKERALGPAVPAYSNTLPCDDDSSADTAIDATAERYSEVASKKEKRDYITRENIGEIMLAQVPGVSPKIATGIMKKYGGSLYEFLADLRRKLNNYEESVSPQMSSPLAVLDLELVSIKETPTDATPTDAMDVRPPSPMNKNKLKHVSECFKDIGDGKRNIGKVTIEKVCYFLS